MALGHLWPQVFYRGKAKRKHRTAHSYWGIFALIGAMIRFPTGLTLISRKALGGGIIVIWRSPSQTNSISQVRQQTPIVTALFMPPLKQGRPSLLSYWIKVTSTLGSLVLGLLVLPLRIC
jgi:hypothetical protein